MQLPHGGRLQRLRDLLPLIGEQHVQSLAPSAPRAALEAEPSLDHPVAAQVGDEPVPGHLGRNAGAQAESALLHVQPGRPGLEARLRGRRREQHQEVGAIREVGA